MQRKLLGKEHPDVAMTLNNLAFVVHDKGDLKTAIELSRASLDTYTLALGADHPSVARGKNNLAMWMMEANDFTAAEELLREALDVRIKRLGAGARRRRRHDDAARGCADRDQALRRSSETLSRRARRVPEVARPRALAHRQRRERRRRSARGTRSNSNRPNLCSWRAIQCSTAVPAH